MSGAQLQDAGAAAPSRRQANQTRAASGPPTKLLHPGAANPDVLFGSSGRVLGRPAYDLGTPAPPLLPDTAGRAVQRLDYADAVEHVIDTTIGVFGRRKFLLRGVRTVLGWLQEFDGDTWEDRWLGSGADTAPRTWRQAARPGRGVEDLAVAANALMVARVLRPSYGWQLGAQAGTQLPERMLRVNDAEALRRLRELPAYRRALPRHQVDAEACLSRVVIRTGRRLEQLEGEHLLHYADVVKTSGRHRREHLAWELMVAMGTFGGEPLTMRAAWSAKGNTRQHSVATLVDRYGVPPGGVRDLLVDYLGELKPSMDYGTLEGWAYRLVRLFWWEVLQINPGQGTCGWTRRWSPDGGNSSR